MADSNVSHVISAATFNGTAFGIVEDYSISQGGEFRTVRGQGKLRPSAGGYATKDVLATVVYLANVTTGFIARGTSGALSLTATDLQGGGTKAYAPGDMVCVETVLNHRDRDFARFTASFIQVDSGDDNAELS